MWQKIFFNSQSIRGQTDSSVLIKMPNSSQYMGYYFWHPKKLVREQGGKGYHLTFSFNEEWLFAMKKYGAGRYNSRDIIREKTISASEMITEWGIIDENVNDFVEMETDKINANLAAGDWVTEISHHTPEKVNPVDNNIIERLKK